MKAVLVALAFALVLAAPVASAHCVNEFVCDDRDPLFHAACQPVAAGLNAAGEVVDRVVCHL